MLNRSTKSFQVEPLQTMVAVGMVSHASARIWLRSHRPGNVRVCWRPRHDPGASKCKEVGIAVENDSDNTASVLLSGEGEESMVPMTEYEFEAVHLEDGRVLGRGQFETFPEDEQATPEQFSIGIISCHQPFREDGTLRPDSSQMLTAVKRCMRERNSKFLLMTGEQMYADFPETLSLFNRKYFAAVGPPGIERLQDCSPETVRRLYQERYRVFWSHPEWQALQAQFPCLPILDDHDILDNWGSRPIYQTPKWQSVGTGARWAYFDYQGKRVVSPDHDGELPFSFHYDFTYGNTATFVMDLRSSRTAGEGGQLFSSLQQDDLEEFLARNRRKKVLFLVLSVPVIHLPRFIAKFVSRLPHTGEDFSDRWSSGAHIRDRDRVLKLLHNHNRRYPSQKIVLLSGDIHIGCVHVISWKDGGPDFYQFISSPVTHKTPFLVQLGSKMIITANRNVLTRGELLSADVRLLEGCGSNRKNPYGGRNIGMVEVRTPSPGADPTIKFLIYGQENEQPVCVYESPSL